MAKDLVDGRAEPVPASHDIRPLASTEDYRACVALQEDVWGHGFSERVPMAILKVGQELGGVSAGAFDAGGRMDGFVFGLTGLHGDGSLVHWSDMLAVWPGARGRGLGLRLKVHQRDVVLSRGIRKMLWTFDPLRAGNAHLNLNKLGAVVGEYRENMYGETDSVLHRGIGTDRFVALWRLDTERVAGRLARALDGGPAERVSVESAAVALDVEQDGDALVPHPGPGRLGLDVPCVAVAVPADIGEIMARDPDLAAAWREATREVFLHYLERGYEVRGLSPVEGPRGIATYLLERTGEET